MPKQKPDVITVTWCVKRINLENITLNSVSTTRFNVYFFGALIGTIQKIGPRWAHFTDTSDRLLPTQEQAAESLVRWAFNNHAGYYLSRVKFVNGESYQEDRSKWDLLGQKAPTCIAGIPIS
jgi:hypothetical protein